MMGLGAFHHHHELFKIAQEDAWERTARVLRDIANYGLIVSRSFAGPAIKESELRTDDDCNDWLRVPGNEMPDEERRRQEDAIIEERKRGGK